MFTYLNDGFNEYNVFAEVDSSSLFDDIGPFNPPSPSITVARRRSWRSFRRTLPANLPIALEDSDRDADGESDDGSDDEYVPPPDLDLQTTAQSLKRRRSVSVSQRTETSTTPSLPSDSSYPSHNNPKRLRVAPPSRNKQASPATSQVITRVVNNNLIESTNFICPECGWKQVNKRIPDFKRHLKTHLRPKDNDHSSGYRCKGVRVEDAIYYSIQPDATPYKFQEHERIGGCMRTFSRRDALKRHLDNPNILCAADSLLH